MSERASADRNSVFDFEPYPDGVLQDWTALLRAIATPDTKTHPIAEEVLLDFILRAWTGKPQSDYTIRWLADRLSDVLDRGKPAARAAFGLRPMPEGNPRRGDSETLHSVIWIECAKELGYTKAEAKRRGAVTWDCDEKTLARRIREAGDTSVRSQNMQWWQHFFTGIGKPLPEPNRSKGIRRTER